VTNPRTLSPRLVWPALVLVAVVAFVLGRSGGSGEPVHADGAAAPEAPTQWTCSMHPQIILPSNDQKCPICFMDLIPLEADTGGGLAPEELRLSPAAAALAEIRTEPAARRAVTRPVRLAGKVTADETLTRTITARYPGRLERLHVDATGQSVAAGAPLAEIYSPQLYAAQVELRSAARAAAADPAAAPTLDAARARLRLLGLDRAQVDAMLAGDTVAERLTVTAPLGGVVLHRRATLGEYVKTGDPLYAIADLSRVWLRLDAFESDVPWLGEGQEVQFTVRAWPGRTFSGTVAFVDPVLDEKSRSVEVRVAVDNADGALKPGMLATGVIATALPGLDDPLVIPASAPLLTGARAVVYVRVPGEGDPVFRGVQVELGPRAGDWYVVAAGLEEGDDVVVHGAFKIDSALQIQARPSMMAPAEEPAPAEAPAEETRPELPASASLRGALAAVVEAYLPLQAALAADDDGAAKAAAGAVAEQLAAIDGAAADIPPATAEAWTDHAAALAAAARLTVEAGDIAARRAAFQPLSDSLWTALDRFGVGEVRPVRRFHCPMAFDDTGADWLQDGTVTANPYFGATMLRCGWQVDAVGRFDGEGEGN
jgi:Cu(I)/Ag(I) efflux system membrane fusion protein